MTPAAHVSSRATTADFEQDSDVPRSASDRIRLGAVVLAGAAGAGLGILLGLAWLLANEGEGIEAVAVGTLAVVVSLAVLFQLMVARAVARLHEGTSTGRAPRDAERRRDATPAEPDGNSASR